MPLVKNITAASLGLYLGMPPSQVPSRGMSDCLNVRLRQGVVVRDNLGWAPFPNTDDAINLDGKTVTLIDSFVLRNGTTKTLLGNTTDLFVFDDNTNTVAYLTPRYETGTVSVTNGSPTVTGSGTAFDTELHAGCFIYVGAISETDPTAAWYEIDSVDSATQVTLTSNYLGATAAGQSYTARVTFTGDADDVFFTEYFYGGSSYTGGTGDDRWYATNGVDAIVAWDGADDQVYLPNLGNVDTCRSLRRDTNRMVYVAPTVSGTFEKFSIRTSDVGKPEDTVNGEAVQLIVHDRNDELLFAANIGGLLAIYGRKSVTVAQYVGVPIVYAFRAVVTSVGPISARGVAVFPEYHYFVSDGSQYIFDGTRADQINTHIWEDVTSRIVPARVGQLHHGFDYSNGELLWVTPLTSDSDPEGGFPEHAYVHHFLEDLGTDRLPDPHTYRDLPATVFGNYARASTFDFSDLDENWAEYNFRWSDRFFFQRYPQILFGTVDGDVFILNEFATQNGVDPVSYARFGRAGLSRSPSQRMTINRVYPYMEQIDSSADSVIVAVYTTNVLDGNAQLATSLTFGLAQDGLANFVSPLKVATYCDVQIGTTEGSFYWSISGYAVDATPASKV